MTGDTMSGNRVEKLESRVEELEASVSGLTEELMQTKARLAEIEDDSTDEYIEAGVGSVTDGGSSETGGTSEEANPTEHETQDTEPPEADDIIVA
ncbi:bZIP transcription factor [Halococcus sp. IIIV-5B]|nr:bZIP transcription factor [Halococcus sp. IIIV-5B]